MRAAVPADIPTIVRLIRALADYEGLTAELELTEQSLAANLFAMSPVCECLVAQVDSTVVGAAIFCHNYSTFKSRRGLYLDDLFVEPAFRGRGIGAHMLRELARIAVERDCGRFEWYVLDWNEKAIRFYQSMGAQLQDELRVCRLSGTALQAMAAPSS